MAAPSLTQTLTLVTPLKGNNRHLLNSCLALIWLPAYYVIDPHGVLKQNKKQILKICSPTYHLN